MAIVALLIKLDSRGPVLFVPAALWFQQRGDLGTQVPHDVHRPGDRSGAQRTVQTIRGSLGLAGSFAALSIDELPQLINVLRGEMSVVGPRPHAIAMKAGNDALYGDAVAQYFHRHRVKPGITGWAQVNGLRGEVDTLSKACARVAHDLYYIEHWSPWLDLRILLKTLAIVIRQPAY